MYYSHFSPPPYYKALLNEAKEKYFPETEIVSVVLDKYSATGFESRLLWGGGGGGGMKLGSIA